MSSSAALSPLPEAAPCALHPERPAVGACARCGGFFCEAEARRHGEHTYCAECGQRPEVSYLEQLRARLWGKRDAWAWAMGLSAPAHLAFGFAMGLDRTWHWAVLGGVNALVVTAWFLGVRLARPALVLLPAAWLVGFVVQGREVLEALPLVLPPMGVALAAVASTRGQLFFRMEVDARKLERLWDARENNPLARRALVCGLLGVVLPVAAPVAMVLGGVALRRVNPEARPPVGRKEYALAGLMLGALGVLGWGVYFGMRLGRGLPLLPG